jgi:hypothetical protein
LGAATTLIKGTIENLGKRTPKITGNVDENTTFQIIHDLLDIAAEQFLILMHETGKTLFRMPRMGFGSGIKFEYSLKKRAGGQGEFSIDELCNKLPDADLLQADLRNNVSLTDRGKKFAQWLMDNGHKADYFRSEVGSWGDLSASGGFPWPREHAPSWDDAKIQPDSNGGSTE